MFDPVAAWHFVIWERQAVSACSGSMVSHEKTHRVLDPRAELDTKLNRQNCQN